MYVLTSYRIYNSKNIEICNEKENFCKGKCCSKLLQEFLVNECFHLWNISYIFYIELFNNLLEIYKYKLIIN